VSKAELINYEPVREFGDFLQPIRNIRIEMNETQLRIDLIPRASETEVVDSQKASPAKMLQLGEPVYEAVIEGDKMLSLHFNDFSGLMVYDELVDNFSFHYKKHSSLPKIEGKESVWPLFIIENSPWRDSLKGYQGSQNPRICHYRAFSMTTYLDVLGQLDFGEWAINPRANL